MNKQKYLLLTVVLGSGLLLSACGVKDRVEQKVGEKLLDNKVEQQTGENVDVSHPVGGGVTIPKEFPAEMVIGSDIKPMIASTNNKNYTLVYTTGDDEVTVMDKFKLLLNSGWEKVVDSNSNNGMILNLSKGKEKVTVTIGKSNDSNNEAKTAVSVVLVTETE